MISKVNVIWRGARSFHSHNLYHLRTILESIHTVPSLVIHSTFEVNTTLLLTRDLQDTRYLPSQPLSLTFDLYCDTGKTLRASSILYPYNLSRLSNHSLRPALRTVTVKLGLGTLGRHESERFGREKSYLSCVSGWHTIRVPRSTPVVRIRTTCQKLWLQHHKD